MPAQLDPAAARRLLRQLWPTSLNHPRAVAPLAAGLLLSLMACSADEPATDETTSTCSLLPREEVATALALPGQSADDLELRGGDYDPTLDGTRTDSEESGPLLNECTAGDPAVATVRVTSLLDDSSAGSDQDVVGASCDEFEPFPDSVDAVGGTCLAVSTEARGRWGDQRILVQIYRASGQQASDRLIVADIAQRFAEAAASV